jgi:hypothetical protein
MTVNPEGMPVVKIKRAPLNGAPSDKQVSMIAT